jgi:hypothetical protein
LFKDWALEILKDEFENDSSLLISQIESINKAILKEE